jgi:hypothetical protein
VDLLTLVVHAVDLTRHLVGDVWHLTAYRLLRRVHALTTIPDTAMETNLKAAHSKLGLTLTTPHNRPTLQKETKQANPTKGNKSGGR